MNWAYEYTQFHIFLNVMNFIDNRNYYNLSPDEALAWAIAQTIQICIGYATTFHNLK